MQDKEINQYNEQGFADGYWEQRYSVSNFIGGKGYFVNGERRGYWEFYDWRIKDKLYMKRFYAK